MELHVLALANVGIGEERVARKMIHRAMVQVIYANRAFSHDVTAAILVFESNGMAPMLMYQDNPVEVELFSYLKTFFCSNKLA